MELMNKDVMKLREDLATSSISSFKQEPILVAAIERLYSGDQIKGDKFLLPERKLQFSEVQQLLKQSLDVEETRSQALSSQRNNIKNTILQKIEEILANINATAEGDKAPKVIIRNQRLWSNCVYDLDRVTLKALSDSKTTTLCYSSPEDKSRFNTIVFVLTKVHELLTKNLTVTRRELFYQNIYRFGNQSRLDVGVRDVCCLLDTPPWQLGVVATAKGLIAGPLNIHQSDGTILNCMTSGGTLIPQDINGIKEFKSNAKYILVVEKDAIFQKLLDEGAIIRLGPVIILTGKGYPDVCTRQLLCRLVKELKLKALALVDADPHGYEIFLTYKYGSLAQSHLSDTLACTTLLLLGVRQYDIMTLADKTAHLPLTNLDKRKLTALIKRPYLSTSIGRRIKNELEDLLLGGMKAEIEAVASTPAALSDSYIPSKIIQGDYLG